jgi:hypothetical protein
MSQTHKMLCYFLLESPGNQKLTFAKLFVRYWVIAYTNADVSTTSDGVRWCTGVEFMR